MTVRPPLAQRAHALACLSDFLPHAGHAYAAGRNTDLGPDLQGAVSRLSPYIRYRLITEQEVVAAVVERYGLAAAEKFVQEVAWRTYWKGWLEMRPAIWTDFFEARDQLSLRYADSADIAAAESGQTGIDGFDDWARELAETGYLHNHARMWFASIWIFTLRLPWELGADFFLRHLLDADAASNTLSWRWVAGLQTAGKTYLATAENIARFTNGRFHPKGLATSVTPLPITPAPLAVPLIEIGQYDSNKPALLLVTHEDMAPETLFNDPKQIAGVVIATDDNFLWGDKARSFAGNGAEDICTRAAENYACTPVMIPHLHAEQLLSISRTLKVKQIVTPYAPVGPVADALQEITLALASEGIQLVQVRRNWDTHLWPHANKGFFPFKEKLPATLQHLGIM